MPASLSSVISALTSSSLPGFPRPSQSVLPYLVTCSGSTIAVQLVVDNDGFPGFVGVPPPPALISGGPKDLCKDVVLAVGINYGQGNGYCNPPWGASCPTIMMDDTKMRPKTDALGKTFGAHFSKAKFPSSGSYHLVSTNIFPFITSQPWRSIGLKNNIDEAKLLKDYWKWAVDLLDKLQSTLSPDFLIFHGARNAVPYFGLGYVSKGLGPSKPEVIVCDNLAPPGTKVSNCLIL